MESVKTAQLSPRVAGVLRLGNYENCVVHVWSDQFGSAEIGALNDYTASMAEAWPNGIAMLALVEAGTPAPTSEGRRLLDEYFARFARGTRAVAHVAEGKGLWAGMARSVMTALQLIRRRDYPTKVFSESSEGIEWLGPFVGSEGSTSGTHEGFSRCVAQLRSLT